LCGGAFALTRQRSRLASSGLCVAVSGHEEGKTNLARRMIGRQSKGTPANDPLRLDGAAFAALFALLAILASLPVLLCETLPLIDYPNHLARMHILSALPTSARLQSYYETVWRPLPNLAMDLTVPPLTRWLPLAWAGKAFVVATLCLMSGGAAVLHRVLFGRWSAWALLAFLLLYDHTLLWGLLNYLLGVGLSLFALALWIALRSRPWLRFALGAVSALVLFFSHLLAFGLYGVMAMGYEAGVIWRERPRPVRAMGALILAGAPFLPPAAIYLLLTPKAGGGYIAYRHIIYKITLFFSIFDNYSLPFDVACFAIDALATGFAFSRRWVRLHPAMVMPLGVLFLTYLIMPDELATASGADRRIPLPLALLLVAGSRWTAPMAGAARTFAGAALLLFLVRLGVVGAVWLESDRLYAQLLPAFDKIPAGSRVAVANPFDTVKFPTPSLFHFPTLAVVRRDAFVPTVFALPAQQPIALRPHYAALASQLPPWRLWAALVERTAPLDAAERAALAEFDFVIFEGRRPFAVPPSSELSPLFTAPRFVLARVNTVFARR
jgi:hypothetical protein